MASRLCFFILCVVAISATVAAEWNILDYVFFKKKDVGFSLKNYCESWRMNVELHNVRDFDVVPGECVGYIGKYMTSAQYKSDVQRASEEVALYLTNNFALAGDGMDAWIFDVDDTLLSAEPYYKTNQFGGARTNRSSLEGWMQERSAPAVDYMLNLYEEIKGRGLKIFIISARREYLRDATVDNLIKVGYRSWTELILRCAEEMHHGVEEYKAEKRRDLVRQGYRLWGIAGDQWSSLRGSPEAKRSFKLPNPMYYVA